MSDTPERVTPGLAASRLRTAILTSIEGLAGDPGLVEKTRVQCDGPGFPALRFGDRMKEQHFRTFVFIVGPKRGGDTNSRAIYIRDEYVAEALQEKIERDLRIEGAFRVKP